MFKEYYLKNGRYDSSYIEIGVLMRDIHEDTVPLHLERCPTSFVFHLVIKLKYYPRTSLAPETGAKCTEWKSGPEENPNISTTSSQFSSDFGIDDGFWNNGLQMVWSGALVNIQLNKSY
ncbi:hypothetical protein AVEN_141413-1 [Araneus ventricosus]|uniref:Uncharacterized protein n=1 Tax=Araneus ventricosus TaxID=182803 RepID=A0A4Y2P7W8_ARAVE|nr:hypothetical protein AVEN_16594-1 [Araneus ventricosus]GBN47475.1 hypothetical protein AVEN_107334-1 [Araneus ventricosus]GBN47504.1 hypothetical protein AVEN_140801-1 [Araneus ventricosus]GBN47509.1 hypothetical protein AVEN_141413-1 [Araneus ventricosus]